MAKAKDIATVSGEGEAGYYVTSPTPMDLLAKAMESNASMEIIERMMAMQERFEANQARKAFDSAMAEAAKEFPTISKSATVNFGQGRAAYKHADLAEVVSTVAPILGKHGLYQRFELATEPNKITVTCVISHAQGHSIRNSMTAGADTSGSKNAIQAMGSTQTYLSRYTLMASLGLAAAVDDDAQSHEPPKAKPDVMKGGRGAQPTRQSDTGGGDEPYGGPGVGDQGRKAVAPDPSVPERDETKKLTIKQVAALEEAARAEAKKGSAAFRTFWLNHNSIQERNVITGLGSELASLRDAADIELMKEAKTTQHDPETGEISE